MYITYCMGALLGIQPSIVTNPWMILKFYMKREIEKAPNLINLWNLRRTNPKLRGRTTKL
ncbi:predicted protein [Sclerotinia sclerotiorum 1980 UF-70]|uniref:Uncharacterized protein n=1 Tax=Sclerotinia sclerotiorum (strain ATCC 18683 / 1980 / Ss-1) TaxID=665079 RepID=A7EAM8_SCLS1|nr:predicted protein [Sclerotinia sclerotiorum 1980 UF-70]EDN99506.1 predicted protein [Sclerotinia sclerotiorum 1980 UF-70]